MAILTNSTTVNKLLADEYKGDRRDDWIANDMCWVVYRTHSVLEGPPWLSLPHPLEVVGLHGDDALVVSCEHSDYLGTRIAKKEHVFHTQAEAQNACNKLNAKADS